MEQLSFQFVDEEICVEDLVCNPDGVSYASSDSLKQSLYKTYGLNAYYCYEMKDKDIITVTTLVEWDKDYDLPKLKAVLNGGTQLLAKKIAEGHKDENKFVLFSSELLCQHDHKDGGGGYFTFSIDVAIPKQNLIESLQ